MWRGLDSGNLGAGQLYLLFDSDAMQHHSEITGPFLGGVILSGTISADIPYVTFISQGVAISFP